MLVLYADPVFQEHKTPRGHPECPARAEAVIAGLADSPHVARRVTATPAAAAEVARVHDPAYVAAIEAFAAQGGGSLDPDTHVSPRSYAVALDAVGTSLAATDACIAAAADDPARRAFAVVRPPGHHARPAKGMGFCLFNNVAIAAARARDVHGLARVSVIDFDVHHGNGTQEAFWSRGDVQYVSLHGQGYYPGTGAADETGEGDGRGTTLNIPLHRHTEPEQYQAAFRRAMDAVVAYQPQLLLISAGFDAYIDDPIGGLDLEEQHFRWLGAELRRVADATCEGRVVALLEGGYALDALGELVARFVAGLDTGRDEGA
ncbi:MAG: histone deacetylase family protein [Planctomycetota bacterium]